MASGDRFEWNMQGLIELSNDVLEADCIPLAKKIADTARSTAPTGDTGDYKASIHVETDKRTGENDWAHAYVVADAPHAGYVEARTGNLLRALNSAG
ncbi:MAG TPA: HK97 gp10 family phage protein [Propionicimonas sp.]|nr:HK97 gp10 family phage protein [Propionicimonas sp.]